MKLGPTSAAEAGVAFRIEVSASARRQLRALPNTVQARIRARIDALADDARPPGATKLVGAEDEYRIRIGDYRVIYSVRSAVLLILVLRVGHRRDVYRG